MTESRVLVIDADAKRLASMAAILQFIEYRPVCIGDAAEIHMADQRQREWLAVVIGDVADWDTLARFTHWLKQDPCHPPLLILQNHHGRAIDRLGLDHSACLALEAPVRYSQLSELLRRAAMLRSERQQQPVSSRGGPTGNSALIRRVRQLVGQVAPFDSTVLVTGESGTGKEVVARAIHEQSLRREQPFVAVNCGAIASELLESELFGHEKGAFTGAITSRKGRFEMADGGTLFLDEIGDMSLPMQVKILRVLQERSFERVGSARTQRCDVRIITATHRNLEEAIVKGSFREDLFYRINVFPIEMPPLRERLEDLPMLADDLIKAMERRGLGSVRLAPDAIHTLRTYHWPGNVRELANLFERLAVLHPSGWIGTAELPARYRANVPALETIAVRSGVLVEKERSESVFAVTGEPAPSISGLHSMPVVPLSSLDMLPPNGVNLKDHIEAIEVALIRQALEQCSGVVAHAAKLLGTRRTTLVEKLRKYGLHKDAIEAMERIEA